MLTPEDWTKTIAAKGTRELTFGANKWLPTAYVFTQTLPDPTKPVASPSPSPRPPSPSPVQPSPSPVQPSPSPAQPSPSPSPSPAPEDPDYVTNGVDVVISAAKLTDWGSGYSGVIRIKNNAAYNILNWKLTATFNDTFNYISDVNVARSGNQVGSAALSWLAGRRRHVQEAAGACLCAAYALLLPLPHSSRGSFFPVRCPPYHPNSHLTSPAQSPCCRSPSPPWSGPR